MKIQNFAILSLAMLTGITTTINAVNAYDFSDTYSVKTVLRHYDVKRANSVGYFDETTNLSVYVETVGNCTAKVRKNIPLSKGSDLTAFLKAWIVELNNRNGENLLTTHDIAVGNLAQATEYANHSFVKPTIFFEFESKFTDLETFLSAVQADKNDLESTQNTYIQTHYAKSANTVESDPDNDEIEIALEDINVIWTLNDGGETTIQVSTESHYTLEEILTMVKAVDLFGRECTIESTESDYKDEPGNYTVKLKATDEYGLTATATLHIVVLDRTAPVLVKKNDKTIRYGATITETDVLSLVNATDNSGIVPELSISDAGGFKFNEPAKFGKYTVKVRATDKAGNYAEVSVLVDVIDEVAPTISKIDGTTEDPIQFGFSETYDLSDKTILALFTATDEIDGKCDVYIKDGEVSNEIGEHTLTLGARDRSANEGSLVIHYTVRADIPPVFILDQKLVYCSDDKPLTKDEVIQVISALAPEHAEYITLTNDSQLLAYQESNLAGETYRIDYSYSLNEELKTDYVNLKVSDQITEENPDWWTSVCNWWTDFCNGFTDFFEKLGNWFEGVFLHGAFDCWINDEEMEIRFPSVPVDSSESSGSISI